MKLAFWVVAIGVVGGVLAYFMPRAKKPVVVAAVAPPVKAVVRSAVPAVRFAPSESAVYIKGGKYVAVKPAEIVAVEAERIVLGFPDGRVQFEPRDPDREYAVIENQRSSRRSSVAANADGARAGTGRGVRP